MTRDRTVPVPENPVGGHVPHPDFGRVVPVLASEAVRISVRCREDSDGPDLRNIKEKVHSSSHMSGCLRLEVRGAHDPLT